MGMGALAEVLLVNQTLQTLLLAVSIFFSLVFQSNNTPLLNQGNPLDAAGLIEVTQSLKCNKSLTSLSINVKYSLSYQQLVANLRLQHNKIEGCGEFRHAFLKH